MDGWTYLGYYNIDWDNNLKSYLFIRASLYRDKWYLLPISSMLTYIAMCQGNNQSNEEKNNKCFYHSM